MGVFQYVLRRILLIAPTLVGVTLVMFALTYLLPGNPALVRLGGSPNPNAIKAMEQQMGLDKPVYVRYLIYMRGLISGDLGTSWLTGRPVLDDLRTRFPATLELALAGFVIMLLGGLPLGIVSATKKNSVSDHISRMISSIGLSVPLFWLGLILVYVLYFVLRIFPAPTGRLDPTLIPPQSITGLYILDSILTSNWVDLRSSIMQIALPAIALGFVNLAPLARMVRSTMLDVLNSDYIRAERAAGIPESQINRDALRNAMIPILTIVGLSFGYLMAGIIVLEQVFSWPGLGLYALQSVAGNDNDPMLAYVLIMTLVFISSNLVVDVLYGAIDPRIRYD